LASNTASEPSVAELSDGRVLVSPRHGLGKARGRLFLFSDDGGQSFSEKRYEPGIPIAGQGEILASELLGLGGAGTVRPIVCCGPAENKTRLTLMASLDDGRTWPVSRVLDDGSAANLALVALPGGEVGVLYERDKYRRLSFQRVDLAALIASR
ncbi:MAG: exo-alpha-sialidase, partial [Lentisphaerae bacterium]|nr:exo-alpha-sialidase [Lentisphaerota bacterium]